MSKNHADPISTNSIDACDVNILHKTYNWAVLNDSQQLVYYKYNTSILVHQITVCVFDGCTLPVELNKQADWQYWYNT